MQYRIHSKGLGTGNFSLEKKAEELVTKLVANEHNIWQDLLNFEVFSALVCKRNEPFLEEMRWSFREKLVALCKNFNESPASIHLKEQILNRHICTLPLAGIKTGQIYLIPTYNQNNNKWLLIPYQVSPIELTPTSGLGRVVLTDSDRLFAYGFTPMQKIVDIESQNCFNPPPHLVFVSPEYPAQQGALSNLYLWFQSVSGFYKSCQSNINIWLQRSTEFAQTKAIVHAIGHATNLALETAFTESAQYIAQELISDAYTLPHSLFYNYKDRWEDQKNKPEISVQMHKKHYNLGEILPRWSVYSTEGNKLQDEAFKLYFCNLVASSILGGVINILIVMPCQYIFIPLIRTILHHKTELALLSILIMVYVMLPGLIMTDIGTTLAIFTALYFGFKLIEPIKMLFDKHEKSEAECHISHHREEQYDEKFRTDVLNI